MGMVDTLLRRKKVVKTTVTEVEEFEETDDQNEQDKERVRSILDDLDTRVKFLELELQNYRRS